MEGDACGAWCGGCGRCTHGTPTNAVCRVCGEGYVRDAGYLGYACEQCLANARARAEVTVERRQKPKPKAQKPRQCVGVTPDEVVR